MVLLNMKTYLALLWGISIFFTMESMSVSIPEINSTPEPDKTTKQMTSPHVRHIKTHKPTGVTNAPAEITATPTVEMKIVTGGSDSSGLVAITSVATTTSHSAPQLLQTSRAEGTTSEEAHPSHTTISEAAKPTEDQTHQQSPTTTDISAPLTPSVALAKSSPQPTSTHKLEVSSELSYTTSPANTAQGSVFTQTLVSPSASTTTISTSTTMTEISSTSQPVSETTPISTSHIPDTAGLRSTAESPTNSFSTDLPISTTNVSTTIVLTTISPTNVPPTNVSTTDVSTTNVYTTMVSTTNVTPTNGSPTDVSPTNDSHSSISTTEVSPTNVSTTNVSPSNISTSNISSSNVSPSTFSTTDVYPTNVSTTTNVSALPACVPKRLQIPTTKQTPVTTTAPCEVSKSPSSTEARPCSTRGLVKHCLIAISSLAALATFFMVTTIILCTRLSSRKYKVNKPQTATEMICISSLLPERDYTYSRQRNAVTNGVLVMHGAEDSDEDGGDNLTLSSFLPDNDRYV
ncbi:P-selectin glycoprotein ligand 1 [Dissostichus eleginoides]|uniref:P-selectin glycoprotein ligand 1 n=1 Tax=Dissostichus eleginoides TaxID=100907 RepID=A0AAD9BL26_DISEL|nr:P-selectin glycoprotein ligand 1 [Dissostichus eleginoides]